MSETTYEARIVHPDESWTLLVDEENQPFTGPDAAQVRADVKAHFEDDLPGKIVIAKIEVSYEAL